MKKHAKELICLFTCIAFLFMSVIVYADNLHTTSDAMGLWQNKIDGELLKQMIANDDSDLITVLIERHNEGIKNSIYVAMRDEKNMDPDVYENDEMLNAKIKSDIVSSIILKDELGENFSTQQQIDIEVSQRRIDYDKTKKEISKREYTKSNENFVSNYVDEENRDILFFSRYTSQLIVEATKAEIEMYAKIEEVKAIYYFGVEELVSDEELAFEQVMADNIIGTKSNAYNNTGYKGEGVKIGIIEAGGVFDATHPQLSGIYGTSEDSQLRILDNANYGQPLNLGINPHATYVTTLLVGQARTIGGNVYEGIVPSANAIVTPISNSNHVVNAVESLYDAGCKVVNISCGDVNGDAYSGFDRSIDNCIEQTGVVIVKSAGNVDSPGSDFDADTISISSPGKAINAITVGNVYTKNASNSALEAPYKMLSKSSYSEAGYLPNKPDISAPGCNICYITKAGAVTAKNGTSFSAPIVTGIVAQMMEANPNLMLLGETNKIKSMLLTGADYHKINPDRDNSVYDYCIDDGNVGNYLREVSGAGVVNAVKAVNIAKGINSNTLSSVVYSNTDDLNVDLGTLQAGEKVRVVMCFSKIYPANVLPASSTLRNNLDLKLYKGSTSLNIKAESLYNNVEIIEYFVPLGGGGGYSCNVDILSLYSSPVNVFVTWQKWRPGDVNSDGYTNSLDASKIMQYDSGEIFTAEQLILADVNRDCKVNSLDASAILSYDTGVQQDW